MMESLKSRKTSLSRPPLTQSPPFTTMCINIVHISEAGTVPHPGPQAPGRPGCLRWGVFPEGLQRGPRFTVLEALWRKRPDRINSPGVPWPPPHSPVMNYPIINSCDTTFSCSLIIFLGQLPRSEITGSKEMSVVLAPDTRPSCLPEAHAEVCVAGKPQGACAHSLHQGGATRSH